MKSAGRDGESSDAGEDDRRNLIPANGTVKHASDSHPFSTFNIDDDDNFSPTERRCLKFNKKRCILLLLIPLLGILLYFCIECQSARFIGSGRMRESELRALNILRKQQLGLMSVLNRTLVISSELNGDNNGAAKSVFEEIKGRIYQGILLNEEIQKAILSTHNDGNVSVPSGENGGLFGVGVDMCGKVDHKLSQRRTIEWKPKSDRYLFAICTSGQMSNHLICLEKHMFFAALLGRVLIIPSPQIDYEFSRVLDIDHINKCLGRKVVITFKDFNETKKKDFRIDRFICYFSLPRNCYVDEDHVKKLESLGLSVPKLESPWVEDVSKPKKRTVQNVKAKFSSEDEVIAIGDVFFADVEKGWVMQPGGPISHNCKTLIEPSRLIMLTAQRFVQTFLGNDYLALHFRRHGWLKFCNAKKPSCFYSVPQAADCIKRVVERASTPAIFLSTDAADSESRLLRSLIVVDGNPVPLVQRPAENSAEKWDHALLYRHGLNGDSQVDAMLDKAICAMSRVFIGSSGSTFTEDILRLRKGWALTSVCDEYICQGEAPNFISEDE